MCVCISCFNNFFLTSKKQKQNKNKKDKQNKKLTRLYIDCLAIDGSSNISIGNYKILVPFDFLIRKFIFFQPINSLSSSSWTLPSNNNDDDDDVGRCLF